MPSAVCPKETAQPGPSLFQNGNLVFQAHHVGWIVSTLFTLAATITSFWLIGKHLRWYTNKREQRYIVRILFMVPIYAWISLASYLFWNHSTPLLLIRDAYESTVLTSFFYLLLIYLSPSHDEQRLIFRKHGLSVEADLEAARKGTPVKRWMFPLGFVKWKPVDGFYFLQLMKWGVLQYCVVRPTTTLAAVVLEYIGLYCEESWGFEWGHIYITAIISLSVTIAMYCLIQIYVSVSSLLQPKKPLLKLFAIKAVVFLTFWQATFLSVLSMLGVVKDTKYMTAEDINIGIGALLETFEMMLFGFLHVKAFSYKPYRPNATSDEKDEVAPLPTPRLKALGHAMDFRETLYELWHGAIYLNDKARGRLPKADASALQIVHYEGAFERVRPSQFTGLPRERSFAAEALYDTGNDDNYRWPDGNQESRYLVQREKSEGLEEQITRELQRRGYDRRLRPPSPSPDISHGRQGSWWRSLYERVSPPSEEAGGSRPSNSARHPPSRKGEYASGYHNDASMSLLMRDDSFEPLVPKHRQSRTRTHSRHRTPAPERNPRAGESSHIQQGRNPSRKRRSELDPRRERRRRENYHSPESHDKRAVALRHPADADSVLDRIFPPRPDVDMRTENTCTQETSHIEFVTFGGGGVPQARVHPLAKTYKEESNAPGYRSSTIHSREPANYNSRSGKTQILQSPTSFQPPNIRKVTPVMPHPLSKDEGERSAFPTSPTSRSPPLSPLFRTDPIPS